VKKFVRYEKFLRATKIHTKLCATGW